MKNRYWKKYSLQTWIMMAMLIFAIMQFSVGSQVIFSFWFYGAIAAPLLWHGWRVRHDALRQFGATPFLWGLLALWGYIILHSLLLTEGWIGTTDTLRHTLMNGLFISAIIVVHRRATVAEWHYAARLMACIMILTGIIAIGMFFLSPPIEGRLMGLGQNDHPLLGGNIYATFTIALMALLLHGDTTRPYDKALWGGCVVITLALMVLSQSRGPLLAFACTLALGLLMLGYWRLIMAGAVIAALIFADGAWYLSHTPPSSFLPLSPIYDIAGEALARKSYRLELWELAFSLITQRPWTGYGMEAIFPYGYVAVNPHNLFISTWYYTGIIGAVLLLAVTLTALKVAWRNRQHVMGYMTVLLIVHGVLACMTDQAQLMKSPAPLWWIFWWGIASAAALAINEKAKTLSHSTTK